jgi:hypothetical protein
MSDEEAVNTLKCNLYAQYLCSVSVEESKDFIDPTTLIRFRKKIGTEGVKLNWAGGIKFSLKEQNS